LKVSKDAVVSLDVELSDLWGNPIQKSEAPVQYLHGGYGNLFPVVEALLEGKSAGDRVETQLEPEDAFGDYDENMLRMEPRGKFPEGLEVGMRVEGDDGNRLYTVTDIAEGQVLLDGNHPLAGMALKFSCRVADVRPATPAEIENGAADDPDSVILRILP